MTYLGERLGFRRIIQHCIADVLRFGGGGVALNFCDELVCLLS